MARFQVSLREVLYRYPETAAQIAVIGACGQMHGTFLLDDRGELVEDRALLWNDKRSQPQVDAFNAREGWEKWLAHLNNPPAAAWPAFKLAWWRENHPDRWSQLAKVLMPKDYINFMLTGAMATDYSEASCYFLMDSETRSWSSQACETFGLRVDQLPELKLSSDIIGQVTQRAADLTGLPAGIPVVAGTSDMAASLLGSGVYEPGMASDSTGTSTLMTVVSPRPLHHPLVIIYILPTRPGADLRSSTPAAMPFAGRGWHLPITRLRIHSFYRKRRRCRRGQKGCCFFPI